MPQQIAWSASLALMMLLAFAFVYVAINSGRRDDNYAPLVKRAYRVRAVLFWLLVCTLGPVMVYTLFDLPYSAGYAAAGTGAPQVLEAVGHQWRWDLSRDHVTRGQLVEFRVTSADVNHGFGIYDADMHLVAQTQAMPGYTNVIRHTFDVAGTYRIMCLEYCGIAHHDMIAAIKVDDL